MTATVHLLGAHRPEQAPEPPDPNSMLLLDWLAVQVTSGYTDVPEDVIEAHLDEFACTNLTQAQRAEYWDGVLTWVDLREGFTDRRILPEAIGCWDQEDAENTAAANAEDAKALLVRGNQSTARGSGTTPTGEPA